MKKMMLMAAMMGLVGTAGAVGPAGNGDVTIPVNFGATVEQQCRIGTEPFGNFTVPAGFLPPAAQLSATYNAGATTVNAATSTMTSAMSIECTKGTAVTYSTSTTTGTNVTSTAAGTNSAPTDMYLKNTAAAFANERLWGKYVVTSTKTPAPVAPAGSASANSTGDVYTGNVVFTATNGQYGAVAGTYAGTLNVIISYN